MTPDGGVVTLEDHTVSFLAVSLGANDYVVTNVAPCASAYLMNEVKAGKLRDRAVNVVTVSEAGPLSSFPGDAVVREGVSCKAGGR